MIPGIDASRGGLGGGIGAPPSTSLWGWWVGDQAYTETTGTPTTLITVDGTAIGSLRDMSGNGRHFYQATGGAKFAYKTNIMNGLPSWRVANGDFMDTTVAPPGSPNDYSMYCVFKSSGWQSNAGIFCTDQDPSIFQCGWTTGASDEYRARYGNDNGGTQGVNLTYAQAVNHLMAMSLRLASPFIQHAKDGAAATAALAAPGAAGGSGNFVRLCRFAGNGFFIGDMLEMLFYTAYHGTMASGDGLLARQYLNNKYNMGFSL